MCIHNLFLTPTRKINPALRHRRHCRDVCTGGHRHHHRRDVCTGGHRHHRRDVCTGGHRHHHRHDVCTGDRDYPILHHVVSACHRLYF
ncbi:hypothetical protein IQ229_21000 [Nostoc cf. edaphicum LEGE 07299]|uniref:Uncharacterized protein n=1 Tax=Nostoc cf. edaphicum LEGE 07299 TaxID=2777974 RepID=A0ABR9U4T9_9NOSO|nr:hypothetical protein [Nostoc cf. edaphicum LEGE 07299]